jgi:ribosomal protein S18 acetylase RimI-like enzyme
VDIGARVFRTTFGHTCSEKDMADYLRDNFTLEAVRAELRDANKMFLMATIPTTNTNTSANTDANTDASTNASDSAGASTSADAVVAFCCLTRGTDDPCLAHIPVSERVELQRLYADNHVHGTGVARALMQFTLDRAQADYKHIWLGVWESNFRARRFYDRFGFARVGSHDFMLGDDRQTDDIFLKTF